MGTRILALMLALSAPAWAAPRGRPRKLPVTDGAACVAPVLGVPQRLPAARRFREWVEANHVFPSSNGTRPGENAAYLAFWRHHKEAEFWTDLGEEAAEIGRKWVLAQAPSAVARRMNEIVAENAHRMDKLRRRNRNGHPLLLKIVFDRAVGPEELHARRGLWRQAIIHKSREHFQAALSLEAKALFDEYLIFHDAHFETIRARVRRKKEFQILRRDSIGMPSKPPQGMSLDELTGAVETFGKIWGRRPSAYIANERDLAIELARRLPAGNGAELRAVNQHLIELETSYLPKQVSAPEPRVDPPVPVPAPAPAARGRSDPARNAERALAEHPLEPASTPEVAAYRTEALARKQAADALASELRTLDDSAWSEKFAEQIRQKQRMPRDYIPEEAAWLDELARRGAESGLFAVLGRLPEDVQLIVYRELAVDDALLHRILSLTR